MAGCLGWIGKDSAAGGLDEGAENGEAGADYGDADFDVGPDYWGCCGPWNMSINMESVV